MFESSAPNKMFENLDKKKSVIKFTVILPNLGADDGVTRI